MLARTSQAAAAKEYRSDTRQSCTVDNPWVAEQDTGSNSRCDKDRDIIVSTNGTSAAKTHINAGLGCYRTQASDCVREVHARLGDAARAQDPQDGKPSSRSVTQSHVLGSIGRAAPDYAL